MKVLLVVLLILLVLLLIPFGAVARYDREGLTAWAKILFFRIRVFPAKRKKDEASKEKQAKEKKGKAKKEDEDEEGEKAKEKEKKGGTLELVRAALPLIKPALAGIKKRLTIDELELFVTWRSDDPADAAVGYGRSNAALGGLWALIDTNFKVKKSRLGCNVDFDGGKSEVYLNATLSLNLWKVLTLIIPLGIRFLCNYTRLKKARDDKTKKEA